MNLRRITLLLAIPALLLATVLAAWTWLLHSESGARWLFSKLESSLPGSMGSSAISGDLGSGLKLANFYFEDGGTRVEVARIAIAVNIDLLPPLVSLDTLHGDAVVIRSLEVDSDEQVPGEETDWENTLQGLSLPVPLKFRDVRISDIEAFAPSGKSVFVVHSVLTSGAIHKDLVLDRLSVSIPGNELTATGQLGLSGPHPVSLDLQSSGQTTVQARLDGSLESASILLDSEKPNLHISGMLEQLLKTPFWDLDISSPGLQWPLNEPEPTVKLSDLSARFTGEWQQYELELTGNLELQELDSSRLELLGDGGSTQFTARNLSLDGPGLSLQASSSVSWEDQVQVALEAVLERLEPGKWLADWPQGHPVNGELDLAWSGDELEVSDFTLAVANTALLASGRGVFDIPSGVVDAELNWKDFSWPPGDTAALISSRSGSFLLSGQPEDWKLDGKLDLQSGELPEGQLQLSGTGNMESLDVTIHEGTILGGTLSGAIDWNWTGSRPFNMKLAVNSVETTPLLPEYPAVLSADLDASGELNPFLLGVTLQQLHGTIREHPVSARGGFHIERGRVYADDLNLESGASSVTLNGSLYEPEGISFAANIDSLAGFSGESSGAIAAEGILSLNPESPVFSATLSGQQLAFGPLEIARIETLRPTAEAIDNGPEVVLSGVTIGQRPMESLSFRFGGDQPLQNMVIKALIEGTGITLELNGSVNDWSDPIASGWSGSLSELGFDHKEQFTLALDQAAAIELSPSGFTLEQACLSGTRDARICLESAWAKTGETRVSADLAALPVGSLELFTDTDFKFTQFLNGRLDWSQTAGGVRNGGTRIEMSPGAIQHADDDEVLLETGPGLFAFEVTDGHLRSGTLDFNFPGSGDIDLDFSIPDLKLGGESPVLGTAKIDLSDIGAVGRVLTLFDTIDGVLDVDLALSGTLSDPAFKGTASLMNGQLVNSALGLSFSEINLSGDVSELDITRLNGSFRAGEGTGEISTSIQFEDILAPVIDLTLKGQSLTVIEVPELKVIANPDLALSWQNKSLGINGRLHIPSARLAPRYLPQATVRQSQDVVIVAGEPPTVEEDFLKENAISLNGSIEVALGDEVVIDLDLAQIQVKGTTKFSWRDDNVIPIADGNFNVSGDIQAFGQFLRVTQGRIGFPGVPADNPHLNIRAEREIFGNSQIRRAGLMVAGTLERPLIEPYTVPMTNKERARTLLVTGSDFNYEQGVGAVDVGMYVLPRLYVSYGIGVFEDGNVLKARYDIGRGFGIRATSGQRETGLDISYTLER